jgi:hypothetical protein
VNGTFRSKVDTWVAWVLIASMAVSLIAAGAAAIATAQFWLILTSLIPIALIKLLAWPVDYTLEAETLLIRSGIMRMRVPYAEIVSVEPTRNPLSSPAMSLDRLLIRWRNRSVMISPENKERFLTELQKRTQLKRQGQRLTTLEAATSR